MNRRPSLILTSKPVTNYARQLLFESGTVLLVTNVKQSALERIAHATRAEIIFNIEQLKTARIGASQIFREILCAGKDSLLHISPIQENLHFSCLVKGNDLDEIQRVKKILSYLLVAGMQQFSERAFISTLFSFPKSACQIDVRKQRFSCNCESVMKKFSLRFSEPKNQQQEFLEKSWEYLEASPIAQYRKHAYSDEKFSSFNYGRYVTSKELKLFDLERISHISSTDHRFSIPDPLGTTEHILTSGKLLSGKQKLNVIANFRACGSYPVMTRHFAPRLNHSIVENGEMALSSYQLRLKIRTFSQTGHKHFKQFESL